MENSIPLLALATGLLGSVLLIWLTWRVFSVAGLPDEELPPERPAVFLLIIFAAFCLLRWPFARVALEFNPDESQMLAQAMRFLVHSVPWRDVDGTTSGPLNSYALSVALFFGAPVSWATARMTHLFLQFVTVCLLYFSLRRMSGWAGARWLILPFVYFVAYSYQPDFVHYSSEALSVVLMAAGVWAAVPVFKHEEASPAGYFAAGVLLGAVPLAKLQAVPMAVYLWVLLLATVFRRRQAGYLSAILWRRGWALCVGAAVIPAIILGSVLYHGAANDFVISYLEAGIEYTRHERGSRWLVAKAMLSSSRMFGTYLLLTAVVSFPMISSASRRVLRRSSGLFPGLAALGWILVCGWSVVAPAKGFWHYLVLLTVGLALMIVFVSGMAGTEWLKSGLPGMLHRRPTIRAVFFLGWLAVVSTMAGPHLRNAVYYSDVVTSAHTELVRSISSLVSTVASPGEPISIWGWMPSIYVESGCYPATRDAICHYVIEPGRLQDYYRQRHLADLREAHPPVFIDTAVPGAFLWLAWPAESRHESFPELASYIGENYVLWKSIRLDDRDRPLRVYLSRERAAERGIHPASQGAR